MLLHGLSDTSRFRRAVAQDTRQRQQQSRTPANAVEVSGQEAYERMRAHFGG